MSEDFELIADELGAFELDCEKVLGQQLPLREDQIVNYEGGYVFRCSDTTLLRRFLILGTAGGTFYANAQDLEVENAEFLTKLLNEGRGDEILDEVELISRSNRAPRKQALIYALALCARYQIADWMSFKNVNPEQKQAPFQDRSALQKRAYDLLPAVCTIPTDLFMFLRWSEKFAKEFSNGSSTGWGRRHRAAVSAWYTSKDPYCLAMHVTKYKNREGFTHRDVLRLCHAVVRKNHPKYAQELIYRLLFHFIVKGRLDNFKPAPRDEVAFETLKVEPFYQFLEATLAVGALTDCTPENEQLIIQAIRTFGLVREHIPSQFLNSRVVWKALLEKMPMLAMIRNLSKMSALDLITDKLPEFAHCTDSIIEKLTSEEHIKNSKIHPIQILQAMCVYKKCKGVKGKLTWTVNDRVVKALDTAFYKAFKNVIPTGKRYLLALDVSGSMSFTNCCGFQMSCYEAELGMSLVTASVEESVDMVAFAAGGEDPTYQLIPLDHRKGMASDELEKQMNSLSFAGTDLAVPMLWAAQHKKLYDVFIIYTDCETYYGDVHPFEAMQRYRKIMDIPDAKLIVCAFAQNEFSIADPTDPNMLDIAGMDSAVPNLITDFVNGYL